MSSRFFLPTHLSAPRLIALAACLCMSAAGVVANASEAESGGKVAHGKVGEGKTADSKSGDGKTAEPKIAESKTTESKTTESKSAESKSAESKATQPKAPEAKAPETKAPETKASTVKVPEARVLEGKRTAAVPGHATAGADANTDAHADAGTPTAPGNAALPKKPRILERAAALEARGPRDPMDMLRERLAQKLGAAHAPDASNPNVLRVVSSSSATPDHADSSGTITVAPAQARVVRRKVEIIEPPLAAGPAHWDYSGNGGPANWGQMKPEFSKCSTGLRQSPIDIRDGIKVELDAVQFDYKPSAFSVVDNGHTVQVNVKSGNSIQVMGRQYELVQFHFHRPSEERVDGKQFDMVVHLVHKDFEGRLAVVAVLLERGSAQPLVQSVWNNLPLEKGDELSARSPMNLNDLLPAERSYYTYMGSLTTPPCSEGVLWMVLKKPVQVSNDQIGIFARLYPMNARPVQSASGRLIKESN